MSSTRPHASERLGERDPAELAKRVRKNHNLSALLLRLLDREEWRDTSSRTREDLSKRALTSAKKAGLGAWPNPMIGGGFQLTALGRQVAELVRPPKWTAAIRGGQVAIDKPDGDLEFVGAWDYKPDGRDIRAAFDRAQRVVDLLNADDLARAKVYGAKP